MNKLIAILLIVSISLTYSTKIDENRLNSIFNILRSDRKAQLSESDENYFVELLIDHLKETLPSLISFNKINLEGLLNFNLNDLSSSESFLEFISSIVMENLVNFHESKFVVQKKEKYPVCAPCHYVMRNIKAILQKKYGIQIVYFILTELCSIFTARDVCHDAIELYGGIVLDSIIDHYVDPEFVCTRIYACDEHYVTLEADDYAKEVFKDKPKKINPSFPSETKLKILHIIKFYIYN